MPHRKLLEQRQSRWVGTRSILVGGLGACLLVLLAFAGLAAYELDERVEDDAQRMQLLARALAEQTTTLLDGAESALDVVANETADDLRDGRLDRAWPATRTLGAAGTARLSLADRSGRFVAGAPQSAATLKVMRTLRAGDGTPFTLVAALDAGVIARRLERIVDDGASAAVLASDHGEVLAATALSGWQAGQSIAGRDLPAGDVARVGAGLRQGLQITARRPLARGLVVVVEQSRERTFASWLAGMRWIGTIAAGTLAAVLLATLLALRASRSREAVMRDLDAALIELAQRGSELGALVAGVQALIFRADAEGRLTFVNARWFEVTGQAAADALGQPLSLLVAPASRDAARALFSGDARGAVGHAQIAIAPVRGGERRFNFAVVPLLQDGRITGYAGSAVDVTEQVHAEQRLKTQLAYNTLLVEESPLPTSLVDAKGRLVKVNQAWERFRGLRREQVLGRAVAELLTAPEAERLRSQNAALLDMGGTLRFETSMLAGDGSQRDLVLTKVAVRDPEHGHAVLTVAIDVSEFREAERATRQARDLAEEASRAKSEFVANISHELRTPLQSILGYSELGIARSREQPRLNAMFIDVHQAGQRMLALVNDLLDVSKIESAVGTFHLERGDVRPWLRDIVRELQPLLAAKQLRLAADLGTAPVVAKVDPLRLQQVVRNVIANAIKFSPAGEAIDVQAGYGDDGEIEISVRDRGPGIPSAEVEKIFEAFVQSSHTKDGAGGTGLGLAISRKIVEAHGGRIWAENLADGGSRFLIRLPVPSGFSDTVTSNEP